MGFLGFNSPSITSSFDPTHQNWSFIIEGGGLVVAWWGLLGEERGGLVAWILDSVG
ncbi:hypothetical protein PVAP13_2NG504703 [Panicum virgatum]|uniref:Uncharacterized protein n=1 Tax=Panicum virgatum TaxID=38727 RepID=A0A8T0VU96_PANVG|nr:hypothetical protein PVAP13_2NG504703 [Panicum virgatum]